MSVMSAVDLISSTRASHNRGPSEKSINNEHNETIYFSGHVRKCSKWVLLSVVLDFHAPSFDF